MARYEEYWCGIDQRIEILKAKPVQVLEEDDRSDFMKEELYKQVQEDDVVVFVTKLERVSETKNLPLPIISQQVSPSGNSLLHLAAKSGCRGITLLLLRHFPFLMLETNVHHDTALHLAVREGKDNFDIIGILLDHAKANESCERLLAMKNRRGNTALHDAVINSRLTEIVKILSREFPNACYYQNSEGKSPLYLAAEHDYKMLGYLLDVIQNDSNSAYKLEGSSPAIAALLKDDMVTLSTIAQRKLELLRLRDEKGGNLLHFAASKGKIRGIDTLLSKIPECQFQCNSQGHYPIHTACIKGHVEIVKKLLDAFYDTSECVNKKGQNILHVASASGNWKFLESIMAEPWFGKVANEQDEDGNTPLHLAAINGQCMVAFALLRHKLIKSEILNNNRQTAYNIAWKQSETLEIKFTASGEEHKPKAACADGSDKNQEIERSNESHVQVEGGGKERTSGARIGNVDFYDTIFTFLVLSFYTKSRPKLVNEIRIRHETVPREQVNNSISSLLVVAVLVAGVAFGGCVTLPGKDDAKDKAPISHKVLFSDSRLTGNNLSKKNIENLQLVYVIFDMGAFSFSVMASLILCWASLILCWAHLYYVKLTTAFVWLASIMIWVAIYFLCLAFSVAAVIAVGINCICLGLVIFIDFFLIIISVISLPLIIPAANKFVERILTPYIYYLVLLLYYRLLKFLKIFNIPYSA